MRIAKSKRGGEIGMAESFGGKGNLGRRRTGTEEKVGAKCQFETGGNLAAKKLGLVETAPVLTTGMEGNRNKDKMVGLPIIDQIRKICGNMGKG